VTIADLFKISIKTLVLTILFSSQTGGFAQTTKRTLLRDNHIKKVLTFTVDKQNEPKYLSRIAFVNDSGLIYKSVSLNQKQDTTERSFSKYDSLHREIYYKTVYGPDSTVTYTYEYLNEGGVITSVSFFGHESKEFVKANRKKRKEIFHYYSNDKHRQTVIYKRKKHFWTVVVKRKTAKPKKTKGKEYFDSKGNVIKSTSVSRFKERVTVGGYRIDNADGKVEKDRMKYAIYRHKDIRTKTFEYNELNFRIKEIYHPSPDYSRPGYHSSGQQYLCFMYEYLKE
jgi:hypothetical protein